MNCPKCGLQTLSDQKFCRSCGASLQIITRPLAEQSTGSDLETTPAIIVKHEDRPRNGLVLWAFIMMFIGVAIGIVGKMLLHEDIVTVVGVLVSLAGMFFVAYPFLSPSPRKKYDSEPAAQAKVLTPSQTTKSLPQGSNTEYVPSITDRTTDLLQDSTVPRPRKREDGESQV
jgi:hypothetical protein